MTRLSLCLLALILLLVAGGEARAGPMAALEPNIVVSGDNPTDYEVSGDPLYSGVIRVQVGYALASDPTQTVRWGLVGTGSVLYSGQHILTAAHMFKPGNPFFADKVPIRSRIFLPSGAVWAESWNVHPDFDTSGPASFLSGADLALIKVPALVADTTTRYQLYSGFDEVGKVHTKAGIGWSGTGDTGMTIPPGPPPPAAPVVVRAGNNIYDTVMDPLIQAPGFWGPGTLVPGVDFIPGSLLSYDFDSGDPANDMHGYVDNYFVTSGTYPGWVTMPDWYDTGLGLDEISGAPGDSGGPTFIDGRIAGVTSISWWWAELVDGVPVGGGPDYDTIAGNRSWGEAGADTRVSLFHSWITSNVPEPGTFLLLALALPVVAGAVLRRRRRRA